MFGPWVTFSYDLPSSRYGGTKWLGLIFSVISSGTHRNFHTAFTLGRFIDLTNRCTHGHSDDLGLLLCL